LIKRGNENRKCIRKRRKEGERKKKMYRKVGRKGNEKRKCIRKRRKEKLKLKGKIFTKGSKKGERNMGCTLLLPYYGRV
jgi:hypothetical protein